MQPYDVFHQWDKLLAAAKSLQLCPTLCDPTDGRQPTRLPCPWDSPGKNTGVGYFLLQCRKVKSESEVAQSSPTLGVRQVCWLQRHFRIPAICPGQAQHKLWSPTWSWILQQAPASPMGPGQRDCVWLFLGMRVLPGPVGSARAELKEPLK